MKLSFTVGSHRIAYKFDKNWGIVQIVVDGQKLPHGRIRKFSSDRQNPAAQFSPDRFQLFGFIEFDLLSEWEFNVDDLEPKRVLIQQLRKKWFPYYRPYEYKVFVDNDEVTKTVVFK